MKTTTVSQNQVMHASVSDVPRHKEREREKERWDTYLKCDGSVHTQPHKEGVFRYVEGEHGGIQEYEVGQFISPRSFFQFFVELLQ